MNDIRPTNGAEVLVTTLLRGGIDTCFANPGTSEMQFVAALDTIPGMRCVLALQEGVATGAADGYARMADRPAATLLHLGPGLANGLSNLHNAKRAQSAVVNIVGEHASWHRASDSPLTSDIEALAAPMSDWVHTSSSADDVAVDAARAISVASSRPGKIATLILPADTAWTEAKPPPKLDFAPAPAAALDMARIARAAEALRSGKPAVIVLGGKALRAASLEAAARIAAGTGARLIAPYGSARIERGAGRLRIDRIPAPVDQGVAFFKHAAHVVLVGARPPAPLFGYPGKPSKLVPPEANVVGMVDAACDLHQAVLALAEATGATAERIVLEAAADIAAPTGALTADAVLQSVGRLLPEGAVVVDESISAGRRFFELSRGCAPHDYLQLTGGSLGCGIPVATGAAIASPGRKVVNLEGDGSAMYTLQGLWTQARERLDVVTVIFANRGYQILRGELRGVGVAGRIGEQAERMLGMVDPEVDFVKLAGAMGVEAARATNCDKFNRLLAHALASAGPFLIEARIA